MIREFSGFIVLALAVAVFAWGVWKLYGPKKRPPGMKITLPDDES